MQPRQQKDPDPEREALLQEYEALLAERLASPEQDPELEKKIRALAKRL